MATIKRLGIIDKIDEALPLSQNKGAKITRGERVAAMILNGLGFMDHRLYMFPSFLENKAVSRLLGADKKADYFNSDTLGRALDSIYSYGVTTLFSSLAFSIGQEQGLLGCRANFDTTSLSLYGDYADSTAPKEITEAPHITHGYSKEYRPDLKQVVLNLATTGAAGFPVWMETLSGNTSDQKSLREAAERMKKFCSALKSSPSFIYVADSAMYDSCLKKGCQLTWLSRVPERAAWVKSLLQYDDSSYCWQPLDSGYRFCIVESLCQGVHQRLCIISSDQACCREIKTFEENIEKQLKQHTKALKHLSCSIFSCEDDARIAVKALSKQMRYHCIEMKIDAVMRHTGRGRPKKGQLPETVGYQVVGNIVEESEKIEKARRLKGRFLLSTNELSHEKLPDDQILNAYKEQSKTESGFRFIKDDTFEVDSIFLKKPERISALMMVMTLCLMVYSVAQHQFRESLKDVDLTIFDPRKKLPKKPTMKRVFKLFQGINELTVQTDKHKQSLVINLNELTRNIVRCFGGIAMQIYELSG